MLLPSPDVDPVTIAILFSRETLAELYDLTRSEIYASGKRI